VHVARCRHGQYSHVLQRSLQCLLVRLHHRRHRHRRRHVFVNESRSTKETTKRVDQNRRLRLFSSSLSAAVAAALHNNDQNSARRDDKRSTRL